MTLAFIILLKCEYCISGQDSHLNISLNDLSALADEEGMERNRLLKLKAEEMGCHRMEGGANRKKCLETNFSDFTHFLGSWYEE